MKIWLAQCIIVGLICLLPSDGHAAIYEFTDDRGEVWYVDQIDSVPKEYRNQLQKIADDRPKEAKPPARKQPAKQPPVVRQRKPQVDKSVEIFVTGWCGYCRKLEGFLKEGNITYKKYDIEKSAVGRDKYKKLGGTGNVPMTRVGPYLIRGFDPRLIMVALEKLNES